MVGGFSNRFLKKKENSKIVIREKERIKMKLPKPKTKEPWCNVCVYMIVTTVYFISNGKKSNKIPKHHDDEEGEEKLFIYL